MGKRKLLLSGSSIAELRKECQEFLAETDGTVTEPPYPYPPELPEDPQLPLVEQPKSMAQMERIINPPAMQSEHTVNMGTVDKRGVPWDARVHSESRATTKDGSWRKRRGIEDAELHRVEAELLHVGKRESVSIPERTPALSPAPTPPVAPLGNVQYPPLVAVPAPAAAVTPSVPPAPIASVAPVAPPQSVSMPAPSQVVSLAHNLSTFKANMPMVLAKLVQEGKINQEYIGSIKQSCGVQEIWQLNDTQQAELFEMLVQYTLITRMP